MNPTKSSLASGWVVGGGWWVVGGARWKPVKRVVVVVADVTGAVGNSSVDSFPVDETVT